MPAKTRHGFCVLRITLAHCKCRTYLYSDDEITEILANVERIPCFEKDKIQYLITKSVIYRGGRGNIVGPRRLHSWSELIGFWQASSPSPEIHRLKAMPAEQARSV